MVLGLRAPIHVIANIFGRTWLPFQCDRMRFWPRLGLPLICKCSRIRGYQPLSTQENDGKEHQSIPYLFRGCNASIIYDQNVAEDCKNKGYTEQRDGKCP